MLTVNRSQKRFLKNATSTPIMTAAIATAYSAAMICLPIPDFMASIVRRRDESPHKSYVSGEFFDQALAQVDPKQPAMTCRSTVAEILLAVTYWATGLFASSALHISVDDSIGPLHDCQSSLRRRGEVSQGPAKTLAAVD
jgi:hypothetical protein